MTPDDERAIRARIRQYAGGKKKRRPTSVQTASRIIDMGEQSRFCAKCGLEAPLDVEWQPCAACHGTLFVPARWLEWEAALTENDKKFLRSIRVAIT